MLIDWIRLIPALALLLTPIALLHGGDRVRFREVSREWNGYWSRTFALSLHSLDLVRAALGAWLLVEALKRAPEAQGLMKYGAIAGKAIILSVATVVQAMVCKEPDAAHAPFTFVIGLVLGFLPPLVSIFALVVGITVALGGGFPTAFFPLLGMSIGLAGFLFTGNRIIFDLITAAVAVSLPWLFTLLFPRHFVCSYRARTKSTPPPPLR